MIEPHQNHRESVEADASAVAGWSTVFARGQRCCEVAQLLAEDEPRRVSGDLQASCVAARAELLVARRLTDFDLVKQVMPHQIRLTDTTSVIAAIGLGPHSIFAAQVAARLAHVLGIRGVLVSASPRGRRDEAARQALAQAQCEAPSFDGCIVEAASAQDLARGFDSGSTLVLGAPGGSWLQRQFFGRGRRLIVAAPCGALVVRNAPARAYQHAEDVAPLAAELRVADALRFSREAVMPVASEGFLVGIVRRSALESAPVGDEVRSVMEEPLSLAFDDRLDRLVALGERLDGSPVPVTDSQGRLLGSIAV